MSAVVGTGSEHLPDRRANDRELHRALTNLDVKVDLLRERQEKQLAVTIALQEHKTIERVDAMWETMGEWRTTWSNAKVVGRTLIRVFTWGCATLLVVAGLVIGLVEWRISHA